MRAENGSLAERRSNDGAGTESKFGRIRASTQAAVMAQCHAAVTSTVVASAAFA